MDQPQHGQRRKGFFSDLWLPVAERYLYARPRRTMFLAGGIGAALVLGLFAFDAIEREGVLVSNGPLSSNHALFGNDCSTCHTPLEGATDVKCQTCHEKYGDELGVYGFASHYLYHSDDFDRAAPASQELACATCHQEHNGLDAAISSAPSDACGSCHGYAQFEAHPQFDFVAEEEPDDANLHFSHTQHVNEVMADRELHDVEQSCIQCHQAEPSGRGFEPLAFEVACASCHLGERTSTPPVPLAGAPGEPGALMPATLAELARPGAREAAYINPADFRTAGEQVRKRPVWHADPWIMQNLRLLREALYPSAELSQLLRASADVRPSEGARLQDEAIETLRAYVDELRGAPQDEVRAELQRLDSLLLVAERRTESPYSPVDETRFLISAAQLDTALTSEEVAAYEGAVDALTQPCQTCHVVEQATILHAQADQDVLRRANFDHGAHVIHARCLDCHGQIPIQEHLALGTTASEDVDHAGIQNLPPIATCQSCHAERKAASDCGTCHDFHPDRGQRANLLPFQE